MRLRGSAHYVDHNLDTRSVMHAIQCAVVYAIRVVELEFLPTGVAA